MTLHQWMETEGVTDAELAARVRVLSRSQISRIRRGLSAPRRNAARALAEVTGIPFADLLVGVAA